MCSAILRWMPVVLDLGPTDASGTDPPPFLHTGDTKMTRTKKQCVPQQPASGGVSHLLPSFEFQTSSFVSHSLFYILENGAKGN